jgi:uncharacterized repeat protein (TIGR03803 family)
MNLAKPFVLAISLFCAGFCVSAWAEVRLITLFSFNGTNGANPDAAFIQGKDGFFYGTTVNGGAYGKGTVFKMDTNGIFTTLASFNGTNGAYPHGALVQNIASNFFGTTSGGGAFTGGTVFELTSSGLLTNIFSFYTSNGGSVAGLALDTNGILYGTTPTGGMFPGGNGTVFKITTNGLMTNVVVFTAATGDGRGPGPYARLLKGTDGKFYGTTEYGGTNGLPLTANEDGMVFQISNDGTVNVFASFDGDNGAFPTAELIQAKDGNFYGTASCFGAYGWGTVFQLTTNGSIKTLYSFTGNSDGGNPGAGLLQGNDGNFYGMTPSGGTNGNGTIFQITTNGQLTTLYSFAGSDGSNPLNELIQSANGHFYGTTAYGGTNGSGTIFQLDILPTPPKFQTINITNNKIVFTWSAVTNQNYQVQYKADMASNNWIDFGNVITATNSIMTGFDSITNFKRFYRVFQQ